MPELKEAESTPANELSPEQRKALSRKRIYWGIMGLNLLLVILIVYEVISLFVK